ncbi:hypothetical protein ACSSS7_007067 [Eimeria intestinalis]
MGLSKETPLAAPSAAARPWGVDAAEGSSPLSNKTGTKHKTFFAGKMNWIPFGELRLDEGKTAREAAAAAATEAAAIAATAAPSTDTDSSNRAAAPGAVRAAAAAAARAAAAADACLERVRTAESSKLGNGPPNSRQAPSHWSGGVSSPEKQQQSFELSGFGEIASKATST